MKVINFFLMAVLFSAVLGTTVSCKDNDEDMYSDLQGKLNENSSITEAMQAQVAALEQALATLQAQQTSLEGVSQEALSTAQAAQATADQSITLINQVKEGLESSIASVESSIDGINQALADGGFADMNALVAQVIGTMNAYTELQALVTTNTQDIQDLQAAVKALQDAMIDYGEITAILERVSEVEALASANADRIDGLDNDLADVKSTLSANADEIESIKATAEENLAEAKAYAESLVEALKGENFTFNTIGEFQEAVEAALANCTDGIEELDARVSTIESQISDLTDAINDLLNLKSCLDQLVTSVLVQGTDNPVFGSFALPLNINSNVLAAYYGTVTDDVHFPTINPAYYVDTDSDPNLTYDDMTMLGLIGRRNTTGDFTIDTDGTLLLGDGNAGTLYLTVNPNTVDFNGVKFTLENSLGENPGVELGTLKGSDHLLTFGYTRSTDNGFYEAAATVTEDAIASVKPRIDINELKDVITELKNDVTSGNGINVSSLVSTLYSQFTNVLDANAVCAAWTDAYGVEHKTYSQYSLAATAIKPLSYAFLKDANYQNFPGIGKLESFVNKIFNKINIPTFNLDDYNFGEIGDITLDIDGTVKATVNIEFKSGDIINQELKIEDMDGNILYEGTITNEDYENGIEVEIDITDLVSSLSDNLNEVVEEINSYLSQINNIISELDKVNSIAGSVSNIQSQIISYLDKLNTKLCNIVNSANKVLQPTMLVSTSDGFVRLSQIQSKPTLLSSGDNITLVPTSLTAEIFAPAFKKLVGVTNVYSASDLSVSAQGGDSSCKAALDNTFENVDLARVIDGSQRTISVSSLEKGYIYEFVYTAVDYSGKVVAEKFYVKVN